MSSRLGMADGRCFTVQTSNKLMNQYVAEKNGLSMFDSFGYRQLLQQHPEAVENELSGACGQGNLIKVIPYK